MFQALAINIDRIGSWIRLNPGVTLTHGNPEFNINTNDHTINTTEIKPR
jgi:hypothetical protein